MDTLERNVDCLCMVLGTGLAMLAAALMLRTQDRQCRTHTLWLTIALSLQTLWAWTNAVVITLPPGTHRMAYALCAASLACMSAAGLCRAVSPLALSVLVAIAIATACLLPAQNHLAFHVILVIATAAASMRSPSRTTPAPLGLVWRLLLVLSCGGSALATPLWQTAGWRPVLGTLWSAGLLGTTALIVGVAAATALRNHPADPAIASRRRLWHMATLIALLINAAVGITIAEYRSRGQTESIRRDLLEQTIRLANSLRASDFAKLSYTAADRSDPQYQRIRKHMQSFGTCIGSRCIYSMVLRNGQVLFGPEDLPVNDPWASVPGTVYEEVPPELWAVLQTGRAAVIGPFTDEFGVSVSAFAPVWNNKDVETVIGIDIVPSVYLREAAQTRVLPLVTAATLAMLILLVLTMAELQQVATERCQASLRYCNTGLLLCIGVIITIRAAQGMGLIEQEEQHRAFDRLAAAYAQAVSDEVNHVYEDLGGVARFLTYTDDVDRQEFAAFTLPLLRSPSIHAYAWVPRVLPEQRQMVEEAAHRNGLQNYRIQPCPDDWQCADRKANEPYHPIYYVEPVDDIPALGRNVSSEPVRQQTILEAEGTGLPSVTPPIKLLSGEHGMVFYWPVPAKHNDSIRQTDPTALPGCVMCVLEAQTMLRWITTQASGTKVGIKVRVLNIDDPGHPVGLCSDPPQASSDAPAPIQPRELHDALREITPVSIGGRTLAVVIEPSAEFLADRPLRLQMVTLLAGLPACVLACLLFHRQRTRQFRLEELVHQRTAELEEANRHVQSILQHLPVGMVIIDSQSHEIMEANPVATAMTGWKREEMVGRPCRSIMCHGQGCLAENLGRKSRQGECTLLDHHGKTIPVVKSLVPLTLHGRSCHIEAFLDISTLRQLLTEQEVNIGLATHVLQLVNRRPPRHIELDGQRELFIELLSVASRAAGGDHCLIRTLPRHSDRPARTIISLKDQSGHEVNCVLRSIITDLLHHAILSEEKDQTLNEQLMTLNEQLCSPGLFAEDDFLTTATLEIDHATHVMHYACCGHPPLLLIRRGEVTLLPEPSGFGRNVPLGALPNARFTIGRWQLEDGDQVLLYTDGLTEMPLAAGRPRISCNELRELVGQIVRSSPGLPVSAIIQRVLNQVTAQSNAQVIAGGKSTVADDVTMVGIELEPVQYHQELTLAPQTSDDVADTILCLHDKITHFLQDTPFTSIAPRLHMVLEEGLLNAWKHGNDEEPGRPIIVRWRSRNDLTVEIIDGGNGFDPSRVHDPRTPQCRGEVNGRGIFLIKGMADAARWKMGGRHLVAHFAAPLHPDERRRTNPGKLPFRWW